VIEIRDKNNKVVSRSNNLRGIRAYARKAPVLHIYIHAKSDGGSLKVVYYDGADVITHFASFVVLQDWFRRWRAAHGALLSVNGKPERTVSNRNPVNFPEARYQIQLVGVMYTTTDTQTGVVSDRNPNLEKALEYANARNGKR
jgi:hypothetical protein